MEDCYIPMVQLPFCSVPACISMILARRNLPLVNQEALGHAMGLILPDKHEFTSTFRSCPRRNPGATGFGVTPHELDYSPNVALKTMSIPLHFQFVPMSAMDAGRFKDFLAELVSEPSEVKKDVMFYLDLPSLTGVHGIRGETHFGSHAILMEGLVDNFRGAWGVKVVDPAVNAPKQYTVEGQKLLTAMQKLGDDVMGGIWLLGSGKNSAAEDMSSGRLKDYDEKRSIARLSTELSEFDMARNAAKPQKLVCRLSTFRVTVYAFPVHVSKRVTESVQASNQPEAGGLFLRAASQPVSRPSSLSEQIEQEHARKGEELSQRNQGAGSDAHLMCGMILATAGMSIGYCRQPHKTQKYNIL